MTYRKFKADYLFTGREMAEDGAVLVAAGDGTIQAILPPGEGGEGVESLKGVLCPGFVNCHCHLELSHMKGLLPERAGMVDFLLAVMQLRATGGVAGVSGGGPGGSPGGTGGSPGGLSGSAGGPEISEIIGAAIVGAEEYMLAHGIVAVGDICNTTHTLGRKLEGRLLYHNFIETMGFVEETAPNRFENSRKVFDVFTGVGSRSSLAPHAPYSVSPRLFGLIAGFPGNKLVTIHNQESDAENEFIRTGGGDFVRLYRAMGLDTSFFTGTGRRSLESYLPFFYEKAEERQSLILVHNVATREEDLQFVKAAGDAAPELYFCLCPNANLYIGGELPDVEMLIRHGCDIVIGTDSLASNHQLNILEELKTLEQSLPHLSAPVLLGWATFNGAKALRVDDLLGTLEPGKRPGLVLIEGVEAEGRENWAFGSGATARRLL